MNHRWITTIVLALFLVSGVAGPATAGGVATAGSEAAPSGDSLAQTDAPTSCSFPVTVTDATGTEVTVEERPDRIVTLAPSAAQTLWELGAQESVVGVSEFATYLDGAGEKTIVNTRAEGILVEKVINQSPDLVIAPNIVPEETVDRLRDLGITVYVSSTPSSIEGIAEKTTRIGTLSGHCTDAAAVNEWMTRNVENVRSAVADERHPSAMYVSYGYTVGADTFIHDVLTSAGTTNAMATAGLSGYVQYNQEVVRNQSPEWLVVTSANPTVPDSPAFDETVAVRQNQTVAVNVNYLNQPAPRSTVYAVRNVTAEVHPEAYEAAEYVPRSAIEVTTTEPSTTAADATTDATTATQQTSTTTPGFGVGAAVGALAGVGLLARRR